MHVCPHQKPNARNAAVAEQADAQDLKSCGTYTPVPVRFRFAAVAKKLQTLMDEEFEAFFFEIIIKNRNDRNL